MEGYTVGRVLLAELRLRKERAGGVGDDLADDDAAEHREVAIPLATPGV